MKQFEARRRRRSDPPIAEEQPIIIQRKLMVGSVADPAEAEADQLADRALRRISLGGTEPFAQTSETSTRIRRFADVGGAEGGPVGPEVTRQIDGARRSGSGLDGRTLRRMETGFGADFSHVRVHADAPADSLSRSLQARAFTTGSDIFFREGEYRPGSSNGDRLLAHELAHTMQQGAAPVRRRPANDDTIRREFSVDKADWNETKTLLKTGEGSANGVFILKSKSSALVVKGQSGAARSQLSSEMMEASGAHAVGTRSVVLASPEGAQLLKVMYKLAKASDKKLPKKTPETETTTHAVNSLVSEKYDSVMVMPAYGNLSNLLDVARDDNVVQMVETMKKNGFFNGLGRIHAADMMMGNEDRLARGDGLEPSLKNTFVNTWSGQAVGLDLDMNAQSFEQITGDIRKTEKSGGKEGMSAANAPSLDQHKYKDYVNFIVKGSSAKKKYMKPQKGGKTVETEARMVGRGSTMNSGDLGMASDPARAETIFDALVAAHVAEVKATDPARAATLAASDWGPAKVQFLAGVTAGLAALRAKMGALIARGAELKTEFGADPLLDPNAFRVREMYMDLSKLHDDATTMKLLEKYAELLQSGGTDADFWAWHDLLYPPKSAPPSLPAAPTADLAKPKRGFAAIRTPVGGRAKPRTAPAQATAQVPTPTRTIAPIRAPLGGRAKPRTKDG